MQLMTSRQKFADAYPKFQHKFHESRTTKALRTHYYRLSKQGRIDGLLRSAKTGSSSGASSPAGGSGRGVKRRVRGGEEG